PLPTSTIESSRCWPNWPASRPARANCWPSSPPAARRRDGHHPATCDMTPDDVSTVQRSWAALRRVQSSLITELTLRYDSAASPGSLLPDLRAAWLCVAGDELGDLVPSPSMPGGRCSRVV